MTGNRPATLGPQTPMKAPVLGMDDYTPQAKAYWWTTTLVGAAVLGLALLDVSHLDGAVILQVACGAAIAALTGLFPVRIPGTKTSLAGAELFIFLLLLVHVRRILSANSWIGLAYLASAAIAGLIYIYVGQFVTPALLAAVPIIAMFLATINARFRQSEAAERRVVQLQESEARLRSAFTHAAVGMVLVAPAWRILHANDAVAAMLGRTTADCTGIELWKL